MSEPVTLSEAAARRILALSKDEGRDLKLRVAVDGGGCSGFQYAFDLVNETAEDDILVSRDGATALIDPVSLPFLLGSEIDFVDELIGAQFRIHNPQAKASCGCGVSFTI